MAPVKNGWLLKWPKNKQWPFSSYKSVILHICIYMIYTTIAGAVSVASIMEKKINVAIHFFFLYELQVSQVFYSKVIDIPSRSRSEWYAILFCESSSVTDTFWVILTAKNKKTKKYILQIFWLWQTVFSCILSFFSKECCYWDVIRLT